MVQAFLAAAQSNVTDPYNPDWNGDSLITVKDLQDLLSIYGAAFSPGDIQFGEQSLPEVLATIMSNQLEMQAVIATQQEYIETLQQHLSVTDGLVLIEGANLQVVSGTGQTHGQCAAASANGHGAVRRRHVTHFHRRTDAAPHLDERHHLLRGVDTLDDPALCRTQIGQTLHRRRKKIQPRLS